MNPDILPGLSITADQIIFEWEKHFHLKLADIIEYDTKDDISIPRHILCYCLFTFGNVSKVWIGKKIHRGHANVINSVKKCIELMDTKREGKIIEKFLEQLADISGNPNPLYTIPVELCREDFKILLPDLEDWQHEQWSLQALWNSYKFRRIS